MYYFILISLILFLAGYVLYTEPVLVRFRYDSNADIVSTKTRWLPPFLRTEMKLYENGPVIHVYVFGKRFTIKNFDIIKWTKKLIRNYKSFHLMDMEIEAHYGLRDPFSICIANGITNGILDIIKSCSENIRIVQHPDLISGKRYAVIKANCKLNLGKTVMALITKKTTVKQKGEHIMNQINLNENLDALFHSLENFTQREGVIGKAVTQNEKTMMPIVSITVGYGGGNVSMGKDQSSSSSSDSGSGALGFGAKLCTDAILVIDNQQNVSIMPLTAGAASTQIIDKIPQIINGMKQTAQPAQ